MKILSAEQIRAIDAATIQNEPVSSLELMERAAMACFRRLIQLLDAENDIVVFCGMGNNGGDGLAIARLLISHGYRCQAFVLRHAEKFSADAEPNYQQLKEHFPGHVFDVNTADDLPAPKKAVAIDALLGTGLNKPVDGLLAAGIAHMNRYYDQIISIDVPSGLFIDSATPNHDLAVHSTLTLTFQLPKLAFLWAGNKKLVPEFEILNIHLDAKEIARHGTHYHYLTQPEVAALLKPRKKFSHKGTYGHGLLLAGGEGTSGAACISAAACLRSGAGLLTVHSTAATLQALMIQLPEAMSIMDPQHDHISELQATDRYDAIAIGPGCGTHEDTQLVLKKLLHYYSGKLVIDADGLNILAENPTWLSFLPPGTLLTPHPKEFERLAGKQSDDAERLHALKQFSMRYNCIVILKDAHTAIAMPDGNVFFNSSGNPGLAKGGSGDALTGILLGLMTRGYTPAQAAIIGTFVHGYAADLCVKRSSMESLLISDAIARLPKAFYKLEQSLQKKKS